MLQPYWALQLSGVLANLFGQVDLGAILSNGPAFDSAFLNGQGQTSI